MSKVRVLLAGLLKICLALVCLVAAVAGCRLIVDPLMAAWFPGNPVASSIIRRVCIFTAVVLSYWAFTRYYERRAVPELSVPIPRIVLGGIAGALSIGITILTLFTTGNYRVIGSNGWSHVPDIAGVIWVAAVIEELVFRGVLFRIIEERLGTRAGLIGSSAIFCLVHLTNNGVRWTTFLSVTLAGLMWALVFAAWRNIWVVAAHHACWNFTIFLSGVVLSGEDWRRQAPWITVSPGSALLTGGPFGPEDSLINLVVSAAICVVLYRFIRRAKSFENPSTPLRPSSG